MTRTSREELIDELIDEWEAARADARDVSPEELCREHPELLAAVREQIAALKWIPSPHDDPGDQPAGCAADAHPAFEPGTLLQGRYELQQTVGEGGFGRVWRAFDRKLERTVAIKIPRTSGLPDRANVRFLEEARRLARLRHPGIVPVYDVGQHQETAFIVSEFIDGHTLTDELHAGPLDCHRAAELIVRVAGALQAAHEQGFVHRDIKPANILVDRSGRPYVTDFGIAVESDSQSAIPGLSGTLSYMAPEQARGEGEAVNARTDVFALGVLLYEMLTGRRPFVADGPARLRKLVIDADPEAPHRINTSVPRGFAQVCLKALAGNPADRYASARAMAEAVHRACRRPGLVPLVVLFAGLLAMSGAGAWLWLRPTSPEPGAGQWSEPKAEGPAATVPGESSVRDTGPIATADNQTASANAEPPTAGVSASPLTADASSSPVTIEPELVMHGHTEAVSSLDVSDDGRHILSGSWDGTMRLWDAASGESIRVFRGHTEGIGGVAFSPDGQLAASGAGHLYRDPTLRLWDVTTDEERHRFDQHRHNIMAVDWAPNGAFVVTGSLDNTIRRWRPTPDPQMTFLGDARRPRVKNWAGQVWAVAISPDSSQVLAGLRDHTVRVIDAESGRQLMSLAGHTGQVRSVAFSPNGQQALSGSLDGTVRLWNLESGELIREFRPGLGGINAAVFTADAAAILCGGRHHRFVMLDVRTGEAVARLTGHSGAVLTLKVTGSGEVLSGGRDGAVRRWLVPDQLAE